MTFRAINGHAIWKRDYGLLLPTVAMSKQDAWARLSLDNMRYHPNEPLLSPEELERLGFMALPVRIKYDEPEEAA
jgi:hypothetical protein